MVEDEAIGEILTGLFGLPYADVKSMMPQIAQGITGQRIRHSFQQRAQKIVRLSEDILKEQAHLVRELYQYASIRAGLPPNARQLALEDAATRVANL
jgi:hypothetical protein